MILALTVLLYGFLPYGEYSKNISGELMKYNYSNNTVKVKTVVLPVTHSKAWPRLREAIYINSPDIIIGFGRSSRSYNIIEVMAFNKNNHYTPDNDGVIIKDTPIVDTNIDNLYGDLKLINILAKLPNYKINVTDSRYLCNETYFNTLYYTKIPSIFLHIKDASTPMDIHEIIKNILY